MLKNLAFPAAVLMLGTGAATVAADRNDDHRDEDALQEVVVTGSRIRRPEFERLEPTTVITSEFLDKRAYTNVIDALNELPGFGEPDNSLVGGQSSEGVGQSFANFFALGSQRTLTLVDGRRFVPENSPSPFGPTGAGGEQVDLNVIPTQLIDRIETVAVGGAPIYGSDAIAGTVNIILKHNYEGADIDLQGGMSGHADARQWRLRALAGENFADGKGNVTLSAEFGQTDGLIGTQRPRYAENLGYIEPTGPSPYTYALARGVELGAVTTGGIPMVADTLLAPASGNANYLGYGISNAAGQLLAFSNGHLAPFNPGTFDNSGINEVGGQGINGAQTTSLLSPQERINLTSLGNFQLNDHARLFGELWYSETHTAFPVSQGVYDSAITGYPAGSVNGNLILSASNPFLSAADQAVIQQNLNAYSPGQNVFYLSRLNQDIENGGTTADQNTRRIVVGIEGDLALLGNEFKYEVSGNYGRSENSSITPAVNFQNFINALNAVVGPNGQVVCGATQLGTTIPAVNSPVPTESSQCAPFNPFGSGVASRAAFNYVTSLATEESTLTQRDFNATLNGPLFALPAGQVRAAFGYENRRETAGYVPGEFYQQAAGYFVALQPLSGAFTTNELYGELLVPVIAPSQDVPFVHRIEVEAAAREVDHSISGHALTWTGGLRFEPMQALLLRGNYTRAIRSPSVTEAFLPTTAAYEAANDPCDQTLINSGPNPAVRAANCAKAGIVQPFSSNILNFSAPNVSSGDPNLRNEVADSRTFGFVLRPTPRVSLAVDYVSIDIEQAITGLSDTNVMDACYDNPSYPDAYCSLITRNSAGQVTLVKTPFANAGYEDFNGIQSELDWSFDLPFGGAPAGLGTVDLRINEFFTNKLTTYIGAEDVTVVAGQLGLSKHKGTIDIDWHRQQLYALWQSRFIGRAVYDNALPASNSAQDGVSLWWVHNLTVGYDVNSHLKAQLVIDNVFDKQAPYPLPATPSDVNGNSALTGGIQSYFSGVLGRYFVAQAMYRF